MKKKSLLTILSITIVAPIILHNHVLGASSTHTHSVTKFGSVNGLKFSSDSLVSLSLKSTLNVASFATIAEAKAAVLTNNQIVITGGYYANGDGGGAKYYYSSTSKAAADNGSVHATVKGGRLILITDGISSINVKQFGAKGDGVTDDTRAFQAAMDYCDSYNYYVQKSVRRNTYNLYLPASAGNYRISHLDLKNVSIIGETCRDTRIEALPCSQNALFTLAASPIHSVEYKNFSLVGSSQNAGQHAFNFTAIPEPYPSYTGGLWWSRFENLCISNFSGHGLHFYSKDQKGDMANQLLTFTNVNIFPATNSASARALYIEGQAGQMQFVNCMFEGGGNTVANALLVELRSLTTSNDQIGGAIGFQGCTFESTGLGVSTYYAQGISFNNCWFENLKSSILATAHSKLIVNNNHFANAANNSGKGSLVDNQMSFVSFKDNNIAGVADKICISTGGDTDGWDFGGNSSTNPNFQFTTDHVTEQVAVAGDGSLSCGFHKTLICNPTTTAITKIVSGLAPEESIYIRAFAGPITFAGGGNLALGSASSVILKSGQTIHFVKFDLASTWTMVGISGQ